MKVNGYQIKEALRKVKMLRDIYADKFPNSLWQFEGDYTDDPRDIMEKFENADRSLAILQELQQWYNLAVEVKVQEQIMSLALAVKSVGGASRREKFWKEAAMAKPESDKWGSEQKKLTRTTDEQHASLVVGYVEAANFASEASTEVGALRDAISRGNTTEVELDLRFSMVQSLLGASAPDS